MVRREVRLVLGEVDAGGSRRAGGDIGIGAYDRAVTVAHPTPDDVLHAASRIAGEVIRTPLVLSGALSERLGADVHLKLECRQRTGSFKLRGAANTLLSLTEQERERGVVAVSSGNHGRAVAHMASRIGIEAVICLSERVPAVKQDAIADLGATLVVAGPDQDDADREARGLVDEMGFVFVHPFDDPRVIAGQGTVGLEIAEDLPDVAHVVVPLSGGGLIAGVALGLQAGGAAAGVHGVTQEHGPAMYDSLRAGRLVDVAETDTLADALAGGLGPENHHTFELCRTLLSSTVLVSEEQIAAAMRFLHDEEGLVVEGGGAVGIAALLAGRLGVVPDAGPVAVVVSGGNVATETLERVLG